MRCLNWSLTALLVFSILSLAVVTGATAADPGDEFWLTDFFHTGVQGTVYSALSQPEGLYIGGSFSFVTTTRTANIARLDFVDGIVAGVQPLGAGLNNGVSALCTHEGDLVAGGYFTMSGTKEMNHVARWDGRSWHSYGVGLLNNSIGAVASFQGQLHAGSFQWDGSTWSNLFETNGSVRILIVFEDLLYVGGDFTQVQGKDIAHVFAWDGVNILPLGEGLPGDVSSVAVGEQGIAFGWNSSYTSGQVARWTGTAWETVQDTGEGVASVSYFDGNLVVSNIRESGYPPYFSIISKSLTTNMGGTWTALGGFGASLVAEHEGVLMLATDSNVTEGVVSPGLLGFEGAGFQSLFPQGVGCDRGFNQLARLGSALLATGDFSVAGGQAIDGCGLWYEGSWFAWDNFEHTAVGIPIGFWDVEAVGTTFFGSMSYFDIDISYPELMKLIWDGNRWVWKSSPVWGNRSYGKLQAVGEDLYQIGRDEIVIVDQTSLFGTPLPGLDLDNYITESCAHLSNLVICGKFTTNAGVPVSNVLQYTDGQWVSVGEPLPGEVQFVAAMDEQRMAVVFKTATARQVAIYDGESWSVLPGEFDNQVTRLVYHRDRLFAGGYFEHVGSIFARNIAVWTGDQWAKVGSGLDHPSFHRVYDLISTGDRLWVTGNFTTAGGHASVGLAAWTGDPTLIEGPVSGVVENLPASVEILGRPYPNPFNPRTELNFRLAATGMVRLRIFDLQGRRVRELTNEIYEAGPHTMIWNGSDDQGHALPSGVYFAQLSTANRSESVKLTLVR